MKTHNLGRIVSAALCGLAMSLVMAPTQASAEPNQCVADAFDYCSWDFDSDTPEFFACVDHYEAVYCGPPIDPPEGRWNDGVWGCQRGSVWTAGSC